MGRKNGGILPDEQNGASTSVSDVLVFTIMSIIGFPVDVHVKDGSIYSGTFHTASIEDAYGIVLKKARMIKKGNRQTNLPDGRLIETLIILSEDLVQVVAKELLLPAECISGKVGAANVKATAGTFPQNVCEEKETTVRNSKELDLDRKHNAHSGFTNPCKNNYPNEYVHNNSVPIANGKSDCRNMRGKAFTVSSNIRQGGDSSERKQSGLGHEQVLHGEQTTDEVEGSRSSYAHSEDMNAGTNKDESPNLMSFERSAMAKLDDPNFSLSLSSASRQVVLPKVANHGQTAKESKLNPRAKLFSPPPLQNRSVTPPAVPSPPSMTCTPEPSPMVPNAPADPEADLSSFAYCSSVPAKFHTRNNLFLGNGWGDLQYVQPVVGHMGSRTQPGRYASQHNHLQAGTGHVHQNSQNMTGRVGPRFYTHPVSNMTGRVGPRFYTHPVSNGAAGYSQLSSHPLPMPHQANLPKHQGMAAMQSLQLCVTPPYLANEQRLLAVPSYIPISLPFFPIMGSIPVPGSDGFLSTKFV